MGPRRAQSTLRRPGRTWPLGPAAAALLALVLGSPGKARAEGGATATADWWVSTSHGILSVWTCDASGRCNGAPDDRTGRISTGENAAAAASDDTSGTLHIFYLDPEYRIHYTVYDRSRSVFLARGEVRGGGEGPKSLSWCLFDRSGFVDIYWVEEGTIQGRRVSTASGRSWPIFGLARGFEGKLGPDDAPRVGDPVPRGMGSPPEPKREGPYPGSPSKGANPVPRPIAP